jgi:hypothetical protein
MPSQCAWLHLSLHYAPYTSSGPLLCLCNIARCSLAPFSFPWRVPGSFIVVTQGESACAGLPCLSVTCEHMLQMLPDPLRGR